MTGIKTLIQPLHGLVSAMLSCLQALCLLPHPLLFIFYFLPSLGGCANEYFMAGNQREFPRQLPALPRQVQPKSWWLRKDASARKPSREERARVGKEAVALVWAGVSCPPPRRCCHCLFNLRVTAWGPRWPHVRGGRTAFTVPVHPRTRVQGHAPTQQHVSSAVPRVPSAATAV